MVAHIATEEERAELWSQIISAFEGYARYQKRTERPIPVVILEPHRANRVTTPSVALSRAAGRRRSQSRSPEVEE
jgi:hypothetical protein